MVQRCLQETTMTNNGATLLAQLAHSDLKDGECVIKLNGEWTVCAIQTLQITAGVNSFTTVELSGVVV